MINNSELLTKTEHILKSQFIRSATFHRIAMTNSTLSLYYINEHLNHKLSFITQIGVKTSITATIRSTRQHQQERLASAWLRVQIDYRTQFQVKPRHGTSKKQRTLSFTFR